MKPRYIKIFIGLLLFYIGFLVINLQIVGQAAVPAVNKNMIGMQPKDTSEEKPEDLKYTITEKPLTGTTLEISGGQTINSPILNPGEKPTWPWYDKQGNPIKQLQDIKTIEVKKPLTIIGDMSEIFARMPKLENIVLDKGASVDTTGVTSFYRVFYQDSAIKSIDLSKIQGLSLDSAKNLSRVFEDDKSLESVTLSKNVDQVKDFSGLFSDCSSLTTINGIDSWKGSSATDVSNMFNGDTKLEKLDLAKFNPSQATNFSYMFAGCTALTSVGDLSQWTGSNATYVSNMFNGDKGLTSLDLTKFNPSGATSFLGMFSGCSKLTSVGDLSKWTGSNATSVSHMFDGDSSLKTLDLSNFALKKVQYFSSMFQGCSELTTITGMNSWDVSSAIFMDNMFKGCTALTSVGDLSKWTGSNATDVSSMFDSDEALTSLDLTNFNPSKSTSFSGMFSKCTALTSVGDLSKWTGSNATSVSNMFNGDKALTFLDLSNFNPNKVQYFSSMFEGCTALTSVGDLSQWTGSNATSVSNMFKDDSSLKTLDLSNFNPNNVQYFSYMFQGCSGLTTITGINSWDTSSAIFMDYMFEGDKNLKSLTLNNANSGNLQSVKGALNDCSKLARLDISKLNLTQADRTDFLAGCNNLWYLTLGPNSVLTKSNLPNAPGSDNPKGYPANITSYLCYTGNWQVFSPQKGENVEEALKDPKNLTGNYTTQDLINNVPKYITYIWEPVPRGVVLTLVTSNIDFQNHFLTPTSVDLSNSVNFTVEDSRYCKTNAWKLGARIVLPKTASSTDEHLTKTADDPILFTNTNEKGKYIRGSQASLQLNKTQLTNTENIFYTQTIQDSTSTLLQINNNLQSFYDDTDSDCTVPSNKVDPTTVTSILEFSTKNAFTIFPGSYNTTIEYTVSDSV